MILQVMGAWLTLGTISDSAEAVKLRVETVHTEQDYSVQIATFTD